MASPARVAVHTLYPSASSVCSIRTQHGRYSGIQGSGVNEGEFLTQDRYLVRWQGERAQ